MFRGNAVISVAYLPSVIPQIITSYLGSEDFISGSYYDNPETGFYSSGVGKSPFTLELSFGLLLTKYIVYISGI